MSCSKPFKPCLLRQREFPPKSFYQSNCSCLVAKLGHYPFEWTEISTEKTLQIYALFFKFSHFFLETLYQSTKLGNKAQLLVQIRGKTQDKMKNKPIRESHKKRLNFCLFEKFNLYPKSVIRRTWCLTKRPLRRTESPKGASLNNRSVRKTKDDESTENGLAQPCVPEGGEYRTVLLLHR